MKPNLKTILKALHEGDKYDGIIAIQDFEKELREMLTKSETTTKKLLLKEKFILGSETFLQRSMEQAYRLAIEEVLGEQQ